MLPAHHSNLNSTSDGRLCRAALITPAPPCNAGTLRKFNDGQRHHITFAHVFADRSFACSQLKDKSASIRDDLQVQSSELFRKDLTKPYRSYKHPSRSMRTCTYISTVIWPTMSVAKATRHSRLSQGCVFSLGLSRLYQGQAPETNLDNPEVSR